MAGAPSIMRFSSQPRRFNLGVNPHGGAVGQFGNPVQPMQFVRQGSVSADPAQAAAIPRRQRSRDLAVRTQSRNRTVSPAQPAAIHQDTQHHTILDGNRMNQAGQQEGAEWLDLLQADDERVRRLEGQQRDTAQLLGRFSETVETMKSEFHTYRNQVAEDSVNKLYNDPDSFKRRLENMNNQLMNEVPSELALRMGLVESRIIGIEA